MSTTERADPQTTKAVVERFYTVIFGQDDDAIRACLHDDAELHQPSTLPYGGIYRGPDAMMELWRNVIFQLADGNSSAMEAMAIDGEVALVVFSAKTARSGKPITACEQHTVRDGRISRIRMFWYDPTPVAEEATAAGLVRT